ncbi:putative dynein regulatory complex subunit 7 [Blattamonas nauphoetae]|uniref:Dynein regulatory complex subunit 7 n=1 Tax=Blattamonas nauphoetae TaxID=2049346 RepID=A0ABQ9YMG4_9EUKA|nr:putative dynein regulatory complex subunit 7 [Blattamonas nauphoetae]
MESEDQEQNQDRIEYPSSYFNNTEKEEITLAFLDNVKIQFHMIFPKRVEMFLTPFNECGVPKFVSTTICPTVLPYPELYQYEGCIKFIRDRIRFTPLGDPFSFPKVLVSPYTTLLKKEGNSFDIATLLCSLLVAAGYDAYCVVGYCSEIISRGIQLYDQADGAAPIVQAEEKKKELGPTQFTIAKRYNLQSEYEEAQKIEQMNKAKNGETIPNASTISTPAQPPRSSHSRDRRTDTPGKGLKLETEEEPSYIYFYQPLDEAADDANEMPQQPLEESPNEEDTGENAEQNEQKDAEADGSKEESTAEKKEEQKEEKKEEKKAESKPVTPQPAEEPQQEQEEEKKEEEELSMGRLVARRLATEEEASSLKVGSDADLSIIQLQFILKQEQMKKKYDEQEAAAEARRQEQIRYEEEQEALRIANLPKYVHSWVLVREGLRGLDQTIFVEATTGRVFPVSEVVKATGFDVEDLEKKKAALLKDLEREKLFRNPTDEIEERLSFVEKDLNLAYSSLSSMYVGVEGVYNHTNFWASLTTEMKDKAMFDVNDSGRWIGMMVEKRKKKTIVDEEEEDLKPVEKAEGEEAEEGTDEEKKEGEEEKKAEPDPMDMGDEEDEEAKEESEDDEIQDEILAAPPTWVKALSLDRSEYEERFPNRAKGTYFAGAKEEHFTPFSNAEGLVQRVFLHDPSLTQDELDEQPNVEENAYEIRETYKNRNDHMILRRVLWNEKREIREFSPGQPDHVVRYIADENVKVLEFRENGRRDGLIKREEIRGKKVIETFEGRQDWLVRRSHTLIPQTQSSFPNFQSKTTTGVLQGISSLRISETFKLDPKVPANKRNTLVQKRVFWYDHDELKAKVVMQKSPNFLTADTRMYRPDGSAFFCEVKKANPLEKEPSRVVLQLEWTQLNKMFPPLAQSVQNGDIDAQTLVHKIDERQQTVDLTHSIFDTLCYELKETSQIVSSDKGKEGDGTDKFDYLAPFLKGYSTDYPLPANQARAVVESFKRHFQGRMNERVKTMERRRLKHEAETVEQQEYIDKLGDHADRELLEASVQKYDEIVFQLNVVKLRLSKFQQDFDLRLREMEDKLRSDPRLSNLYRN